MREFYGLERHHLPSAMGEAAGRDLLSFLAEGTAGTIGDQFFHRLVEHVALALRADVAFVAELVPGFDDRARFLACWERGRHSDRQEYCVVGTPCAEVGDADLVSHPQGVLARYPDDEMVVELRLDSYLAVAMRGADGSRIGHLGVLATGSLSGGEEDVRVLRIFAARAAAEVERRRHEHALREREAAYRELAKEQAALRHVATLVAAAAPEREVLACVASEVGLLFAADVASLVRCDGHTGEIVAGWSRRAGRRVPIGHVFDLDGAPATKRALATGRPARADEDQLPQDDVNVRGLGIRSAIAAPIDVDGRCWGVVRAAKSGDEPLPVGSERRLGDFAELAAQAIANAEAREQLAASRARIVQAGDVARRQIERNLHDGAQQRLVAVALSLALLERRLEHDPDVARELGIVSRELRHALDELRELARGIHPTILTNYGLRAALEALAARSPVPVELSAMPSDPLPEQVEATVYYVVAESLTSIAKYARAGSATVSVTVADGRLLIDIRDDGAGGASIDGGSGLRGLADRVEALRGALQVDSPPGQGTSLRAAIPIR